jgi:hypothetical protein
MPTTVENFDLAEAMADQIRDALEDALSTTDLAIQVEPMIVFDATPPTVDIWPGDVPRGTDSRAFGIRGEFLFNVRCRVDQADADANQRLLYAFQDDVNALSVVNALLDDPTLGGIASDVSVDEASVTGFLPYGTLVGFQFTASVIRADS